MYLEQKTLVVFYPGGLIAFMIDDLYDLIEHLKTTLHEEAATNIPQNLPHKGSSNPAKQKMGVVAAFIFKKRGHIG